MSFKVVDSRTGEKRERKRPIMAVTIAPALLLELDELAKKYGLARAKIVERCILYGVPRLRKELEPPTLQEEAKPEEPKDETTEQRFMRRKLFNVKDDEGWTPVGIG